MSQLVTPYGTFNLIQYETEQEFERAVVAHVNDIFGERRIYLDSKRRIGAKDGKQSVPDAYLIDVSSPSDPQLYVVENELSSHDLFKHIGVQLLQFSVSFAQAGRTIKQILFDEVSAEPKVKARCEKYAQEGGFRNVDHFLESLVLDKEFRALVIIDEETDDLHAVTKNLGFPVEIIEFSTYISEKGEYIHHFEPFLADVEAVDVEVADKTPVQKQRPRDHSDLDTVVVPAHEDGFEEVFLGQNRWYAGRIHPSMAKQLKFIAVYVTAPTSAITHYASIQSIEPWQNTGKAVVNFSEPAKALKPELKLTDEGKVSQLYGMRYTTFEKLKKATTMDEVF
jgi:hypothetical protein